VAQVEHDAPRALVLRLAHGVVDLGVRARAERLERDDRDLLSAVAYDVALDDGDADRGARDLARELLRAPAHAQRDARAGRALDERDRRVLRLAREALAVGGDDEVALPDAGALGGRAVVDLRDTQAAGVALHGEPDAGEAALLGLAEGAVLVRAEVGGELIVQRRDRALERRVDELRARDLAVVVGGDPVQALAQDARVLVADERVAQRLGQRRGVAAEPDPEDE
jgi:hypothetical protein